MACACALAVLAGPPGSQASSAPAATAPEAGWNAGPGARTDLLVVKLRDSSAARRFLAEGGRLTAPMPGKVVSFAVKAGDAVSKGQVLAVMEAMKMEHTIAAPGDGVVAELLYAPGDQVAEGAELLKLSAA